jgi:hypothetical protein
LAQQPEGCGQFAWPLAEQRRLLESPDKPTVPSGAEAAVPVGRSFVFRLAAWPDAKLAAPLARKPKHAASFAGFVPLSVTGPGRYDVTVSADAWIDVIQAGVPLKPVEFTGRHDCPGLRKSVRFAIEKGPAILQLSDVETGTIGVVVTPVP